MVFRFPNIFFLILTISFVYELENKVLNLTNKNFLLMLIKK